MISKEITNESAIRLKSKLSDHIQGDGKILLLNSRGCFLTNFISSKPQSANESLEIDKKRANTENLGIEFSLNNLRFY